MIKFVPMKFFMLMT